MLLVCKYQYNIVRKGSGLFQLILCEQRRKLKHEIIQLEMIRWVYIPNFYTYTINHVKLNELWNEENIRIRRE